MDKVKVRKYLRLASVIVFSMMVGSVITMFIKGDNFLIKGKTTTKKAGYSEFEPLYETYDTLTKEYYKDVDSKKLIEGAINGMLGALGDQHTIYFDEKSKDDFDTQLQGKYYGIGAQIQYVEENKVKITTIFDGSPAEKAGLKVGDIFVSIDGKSTDGMDANDIASVLKSDKVSKSKLIMNRDGKEIEIEITKDNITLLSVSSKMLEDDIGYINVSLFGKLTNDQFKEAIKKLEKKDMKSLIIDLRGNTGGYLSTVTDMLETFVKKDKILYKIESNDGIKEYKSSAKDVKKYDIVVLVDGISASASEIMAASLKYNCDAKLVGKTTFGKGTVQITKNLSNNTMIKYTVEKWLTPEGNNLDGEGIKPDYDVDLTEDYANEPTDENDTQLQKAIEILK